MGYVELSDGISNRRIKVPELARSIRIDVTGEVPHVVVPAGTTVERFPANESASDTESRSSMTGDGDGYGW